MDTSAEGIERAERDAEILRLRRQGLTMQDIADRFDLSQPRISQIVKAALAALPATTAEEIRAQELEYLDQLRAEVAEVIKRRHAVLYQGVDTGFEDDGPLLQAIAQGVRVSESIRKLTGADAPARTDLGGTVHTTFELVGFSPDDV